MAELQRPEIDVVASSVRGVQKLNLRRVRKHAPAVRAERADDPLQDFPLILPGILVHTRHDERHAEPLDKRKQVFQRPVLQTVQPGQNPDFAGARRVGPPPVLVDDEFVRFQLHAGRKLVGDEARDHAVPQREAVRFDGLEPFERASLLPDDFSGGERQDHRVELIAQQLLEGLRPVGEAEGKPGRLFRGLSGAAGPDFPADAAERVRALIHRALDVPVAFEDFAAAETELFDVAGVRGPEQRGQARRRVTCGSGVTIPVFRQDDHLAGGSGLARPLPPNRASLISHVRSPFSDC